MSAGDPVQRKAVHGTFTLERTYPATPARVFRAFAEREAKSKWFSGPKGVEDSGSKFEFHVDGQEVVFGRHADGILSGYYAVYQDIVPDERIVYAYRMTINGVPISASLATIELTPRNDGTHVKWTETGVYLDGFDNPAVREGGTGWLMDKIGLSLDD